MVLWLTINNLYNWVFFRSNEDMATSHIVIRSRCTEARGLRPCALGLGLCSSRAAW